MDRRWFLGAVGAVFGTLVTPVVLGQKKKVKVELADPVLLTSDAPRFIMHHMGGQRPQDGAPGFCYGALWQPLHGEEVLVNTGTTKSACWVRMDGDPQRIVKMVLQQRLVEGRL